MPRTRAIFAGFLIASSALLLAGCQAGLPLSTLGLLVVLLGAPALLLGCLNDRLGVLSDGSAAGSDGGGITTVTGGAGGVGGAGHWESCCVNERWSQCYCPQSECNFALFVHTCPDGSCRRNSAF